MSAVEQTNMILERLKICNQERRGEVLLDGVKRAMEAAIGEANDMLHQADEIVTALTAERDALLEQLGVANAPL